MDGGNPRAEKIIDKHMNISPGKYDRAYVFYRKSIEWASVYYEGFGFLYSKIFFDRIIKSYSEPWCNRISSNFNRGATADAERRSIYFDAYDGHKGDADKLLPWIEETLGIKK